MSLAGFATLIKRESVFAHVSGINLELNSTRRLGAELVLCSDPTGWLSLGAEGTFVDARFVESGNPVPLAPRLLGGCRAVPTHPEGFRGGLRFLAVAPRTLPHGARGAGLTTLDATLGYHWRWLRVDLEIENILDQQLREGEYHYASHWRPGDEPSGLPVLHYAAGPPLNARLTMGAVL
jgi:iron complex outermembrane recepter protein